MLKTKALGKDHFINNVSKINVNFRGTLLNKEIYI